MKPASTVVFIALVSSCALHPKAQPERRADASPWWATQPVQPPFDTPADDFDKKLGSIKARGFTLTGAPLEHRLDAFEPFDIDLDAGKFYTLAVKLADGAAFSEEARHRGLSFFSQSSTGGPQLMLPGVTGAGIIADRAQDLIVSLSGPPRIDPNSAPLELWCSREHGHCKVSFRLVYTASMSDETTGNQIGHGNATVQLYSRPFTPGEYHQAYPTQQEIAAANREWSKEHRQRLCSGCLREFDECKRESSDLHSCIIKYKTCAEPAVQHDLPTWSWCRQPDPRW